MPERHINTVSSSTRGSQSNERDAADLALALRLLGNEPGATTEAWSRFAPLVRGILRRVLGDGCEVEDVSQEVFSCFFQRVPRLRNPQALRAFVIRIAVRCAQRERRRRSRRRLRLGYDASLGDVAIAPMDVAAHHALNRLLEVLGRLRARDRAAFVLRYVEKMRSEEVARMLDISVPTARRRFTRALGRLRFHAERDAFLVDYVARRAPSTDRLLVACG